MRGFIKFIREQGVMGLAVGFVLGASVAQLVNSLVDDIINPLIGLLLGRAQNLTDAYFMIGTAKIMWGHFLAVFIDFVVVSLVIYFTVTLFKFPPKKK
jgi:large conductance mechanosensitive channel